VFEQQQCQPACDGPLDLIIRVPVQVVQFKPEIRYVPGKIVFTLYGMSE
jgi:hypothetical protein